MVYHKITKYTCGESLKEQIERIDVDENTRLIFADGNVLTSRDLMEILELGFDLTKDIDIHKAVFKPKEWILRKKS